MRHTISCLALNEPGVLAQIAESFAGQKVNILSLSAGMTEDPTVSRMTIVVEGDNATIARAEKLVQDVPSVLRLEDLASRDFLSLELLLVKVKVAPDAIARVMQMAEMFNARVMGLTAQTMTLEMADESHRVDALLKLLQPFRIVSMARSGLIAVSAEDET